MRIDLLEVENFKKFARRTISLHPHFTLVRGFPDMSAGIAREQNKLRQHICVAEGFSQFAGPLAMARLFVGVPAEKQAAPVPRGGCRPEIPGRLLPNGLRGVGLEDPQNRIEILILPQRTVQPARGCSPRSSSRQRDNEDVTETEKIRQWVQTWKAAGPELEKIRLREIREEDNLVSLKLLARAFNHATRSQPPAASSGLVEMQRYFAKLRR